MRTAFTSARVGIAKYVVPFAFIYNSSLLLDGPVWLSFLSFSASLTGLWALSVALEGWVRGRDYSLPMRLLLGVLGIALLLPPTELIIGLPGYYYWLAAFAGVGLFVRSARRPKDRVVA